jgi:Lipid A 3-O-deacylase (PagL)
MLSVAILSCVIGVAAEGVPGALGAAGATGAAGAWRIDVGAAVLREAWDFNDSTEHLGGFVAGVDRRVWRALFIRGELLALRAMQDGDDSWVRGFTVGTRMRWGEPGFRPVVDVAFGLSSATRPVPPGGTAFNYLAAIGAGVEMPVRPAIVTVTARWLHASNNGREGRQRNPDIQSLGAVVSVGWEY